MGGGIGGGGGGIGGGGGGWVVVETSDGSLKLSTEWKDSSEIPPKLEELTVPDSDFIKSFWGSSCS